jgi:hypothetical protein
MGWRYHAAVTDGSNWDAPPAEVPEIPPPPRLTQTELAVWVVYGLVAVLLAVLPALTRSFGLPDVAAWVLLLLAVAMSGAWMHSGALRAPEWLTPDDYEKFLTEIQQVPEPTPKRPYPPTPSARPEGPGQSASPSPGP